MATGEEKGSSGISDALERVREGERVEKGASRTEGHLSPVSMSLPSPCLFPHSLLASFS